MINKTIVFVINSLGIGGASKVISFVANTSTKYFSKVYIVTLDNAKPLAHLNDEVEVINLGLNYYDISKKNLNKISQKLIWMKKLRLAIKQLNPDIIMPFITDVIILTKIAMIGYKATYLASERGDPTSYPMVWKVLSKIIYPSYNSIVFQTEGASRCFNSHIRKKSKIIANPFFLNGEDIKPYNSNRKKCIVSAGRLSSEKCFDDLIKAFIIVNKKYPEYELVIYGEGVLRNELQSIIDESKLTDKIKLPGYVVNVAKEISDSEIFVLSSKSEGVPNVVIEAMSVGLPVISTDCKPGGPAFLINNNINGILIPIGNIEKMAEKIIFLIENPSIAKKMGNEATKIRDRLNPQLISMEWIEYFKLFT